MYDVHVGNSPSYTRDIVTTCRFATKRSGFVADDRLRETKTVYSPGAEGGVLCAIICPLILTLDPCRGPIGD